MILSGDVVDHDWSGMSNDAKCKRMQRCRNCEAEYKPNRNRWNPKQSLIWVWSQHRLYSKDAQNVINAMGPTPRSNIFRSRSFFRVEIIWNYENLWSNAVSQWISMDFLQCRWAMLTYVYISQRFTKNAGSWNPSCSLNLSDIWVVCPKRGSRQEAVGIRLPSSGLHTETVDMLGLQRISWTRLSMRSSWGNVLSWDTRHIWHVSDE